MHCKPGPLTGNSQVAAALHLELLMLLLSPCRPGRLRCCNIGDVKEMLPRWLHAGQSLTSNVPMHAKFEQSQCQWCLRANQAVASGSYLLADVVHVEVSRQPHDRLELQQRSTTASV